MPSNMEMRFVPRVNQVSIIVLEMLQCYLIELFIHCLAGCSSIGQWHFANIPRSNYQIHTKSAGKITPAICLYNRRFISILISGWFVTSIHAGDWSVHTFRCVGLLNWTKCVYIWTTSAIYLLRQKSIAHWLPNASSFRFKCFIEIRSRYCSFSLESQTELAAIHRLLWKYHCFPGHTEFLSISQTRPKAFADRLYPRLG